MNNLNNLILEGKILRFTKNAECIDFILKVSRYEKNDNGEPVESYAEVPCRITGNFIKTFERFCEIGSGLRVVGRLAGDEKSLVVIGEHIEFKPFYKKSGEPS